MEPEDFIADMEQMTVNEPSVKKTRKLASKKGSSNAGIEAGEDDEPSSVPPPPEEGAQRRQHHVPAENLRHDFHPRLRLLLAEGQRHVLI